MQLKQNLELSKSVLRLTDDQRAMRTQIAELEDTITSLNQQLLNAQEVCWCEILYGKTDGGVQLWGNYTVGTWLSCDGGGGDEQVLKMKNDNGIQSCFRMTVMISVSERKQTKVSNQNLQKEKTQR